VVDDSSGVAVLEALSSKSAATCRYDRSSDPARVTPARAVASVYGYSAGLSDAAVDGGRVSRVLSGSEEGFVAPNSLSRGLTHADEGIRPYSVQRTVTAGHGGDIQAYHLDRAAFR
jgi:hypothetical protein